MEGLGGSLDVAGVLDFVDSGRDLVLADDTHIVAECGIDFDEEVDVVIVDHTTFAVNGEGQHTLIIGENLIKSAVLLGQAASEESPVLLGGIDHSVDPASELVVKVLTASELAFSANPNAELGDPSALIGTSIGLISAVQARNNARVLVFRLLQ